MQYWLWCHNLFNIMEGHPNEFNDISNLIQLKIISLNWTESDRIIEVMSIHCHWWKTFLNEKKKFVEFLQNSFLYIAECLVRTFNLQQYLGECICFEFFLMEILKRRSLICLELEWINNWMQSNRNIGLSSTQFKVSESYWFTGAPSNS